MFFFKNQVTFVGETLFLILPFWWKQERGGHKGGQRWMWDDLWQGCSTAENWKIICFALTTWWWETLHFDSTLSKQNLNAPLCLTPCHAGDTMMNNTDPATETRRIWKILSLRESSHLIGTHLIHIGTGEKAETEKIVGGFTCYDYQDFYHSLQPGYNAAALKRHGSEGKETVRATVASAGGSGPCQPGHTQCLSWSQKIVKRALREPTLWTCFLPSCFQVSTHHFSPFLGPSEPLRSPDLSSRHLIDKRSWKQIVLFSS